MLLKNKKISILTISGIICLMSSIIMLDACSKKNSLNSRISDRVDSVLKKMTLEEKIGQMALLSSWGSKNQPLNEDQSYLDEIRAGRVGCMINVTGAEMVRKLQKIAIKDSRLGIPLLFGYDVIHGYRTIFPNPLAQAATWDTMLVENAARISALEATSAGIQWTFAPMADITRDPRWGRISESCGEDPFLSSVMVDAQILGFQGKNLALDYTMAACAKHFVGYGAAEGGRDYNTCELSDRTLKEIYFPPFKAAIKSNVASIMMALNDLDGVPSSSSEKLKHILRDRWKYNSIIVSDWNSIGEMVSQGKAVDAKDACRQAFNASIDIDMQGNIYVNQLMSLIKDKVISEKDIDNAVRRILRLKFQLGLFDDPYRYCNQAREDEFLLHPNHKVFASNIASSSIVLLKNNNNILPLKKGKMKIALVGPLADNTGDVLGSWRAQGKPEETISLLTGLRAAFPDYEISYVKGCDINTEDISGFNDAIKIASKADIIIAAMGESSPEVNKTLSSSDISLPGKQREFLMELKKTGKPIVLVLLNGRPLALEWEAGNLDAILEAWFPGTMTGQAIANVLSGKINPSGKLPVSFPYVTGQIPVYYNHKKFGRTPMPNSKEQAKYDDGPVEALYPFGYGLSYTTFEYSDLKVDNKTISLNDTLSVRVTVTNTGKYDGCEVVELYTRDLVGSVTRPIQELKAFKKVFIETGNSIEVAFKLPVSDLAFYDINLNYRVEPGDFNVMVGGSSVNYLKENFTVVSK